MNELDELTHVANCLVEMRKASDKVRKRFGFRTYRALEEAKQRIMGAIGGKPIELDGYTLYREDKPIFQSQGGKQISVKSKIKLTEL